MIQSLEGSRISVTEMKQNIEDPCDKSVVQLHLISKTIGEVLDVAKMVRRKYCDACHEIDIVSWYMEDMMHWIHHAWG